MTVLLYHAVDECRSVDDPDHLVVSPQAFARQLTSVAARRDAVDLTTALANGGRGRQFAVTFDDGFANVLHKAVPVLARLGIRATAFVSSGLLGRESPLPSSGPFARLTVSELRELSDHVDIGSHGHAHIDLSRASRQEVETDLRQSREILGEILGAAPPYLAWPFGRSSAASREIAAALGFTDAFATERYADGPFARERVEVYPKDGAAMFRFKSSGLYGPLRRSRLAAGVEPALGRLSSARRRK
jgi:peptidoglycan/xylan/chitin deacetylase (PgdA/CDA1 family)